MRVFKIIVAASLSVFFLGVTVAIYLQSHGAALSVGLLLALIVASFLFDRRRSLSARSRTRGRGLSENTRLAVSESAALTRLQEGEVRGTPNYKGN
ncbi:MAG: hypothetical protein CVT73_11585 [Alphaproteobacteria bacterium HGW-Alphaproteobacteria-12]|nr:MAG: hypothetical protein CVT73_11585 [Alphaproteobacteria bacterium HGW-Alphaproteobacteria-12]